MEAYEKATSKVSNTQNSELNNHIQSKIYIYIYIVATPL